MGSTVVHSSESEFKNETSDRMFGGVPERLSPPMTAEVVLLHQLYMPWIMLWCTPLSIVYVDYALIVHAGLSIGN